MLFHVAIDSWFSRRKWNFYRHVNWWGTCCLIVGYLLNFWSNFFSLFFCCWVVVKGHFLLFCVLQDRKLCEWLKYWFVIRVSLAESAPYPYGHNDVSWIFRYSFPCCCPRLSRTLLLLRARDKETKSYLSPFSVDLYISNRHNVAMLVGGSASEHVRNLKGKSFLKPLPFYLRLRGDCVPSQESVFFFLILSNPETRMKIFGTLEFIRQIMRYWNW